MTKAAVKKAEIQRAEKSLALQLRIRANMEESRKNLTGVSVDVIDMDAIIAHTDELIIMLRNRIGQIERRF